MNINNKQYTDTELKKVSDALKVDSDLNILINKVYIKFVNDFSLDSQKDNTAHFLIYVAKELLTYD